MVCLFDITYQTYNCITVFPYYKGDYESRQMIYSILERICCEYIGKQLNTVRKKEANDIMFKCFIYLDEEIKDSKLKLLNKDVSKTRYGQEFYGEYKGKKMNEYVFVYQFVEDIYNYEKCFLNIDTKEYKDYTEVYSKLI